MILHRVVHVRKAKFDEYIGRAFAEFPATPFGNPFRLQGQTRFNVLLQFAEYWYAPEQKKLRNLARIKLTRKVLGCWCKPFDCHGDIIAGYLDWREGASDGCRTLDESGLSLSDEADL